MSFSSAVLADLFPHPSPTHPSPPLCLWHLCLIISSPPFSLCSLHFPTCPVSLFVCCPAETTSILPFLICFTTLSFAVRPEIANAIKCPSFSFTWSQCFQMKMLVVSMAQQLDEIKADLKKGWDEPWQRWASSRLWCCLFPGVANYRFYCLNLCTCLCANASSSEV